MPALGRAGAVRGSTSPLLLGRAWSAVAEEALAGTATPAALWNMGSASSSDIDIPTVIKENPALKTVYLETN
eukprot:3938685-Rhodomonas_salina.1